MNNKDFAKKVLNIAKKYKTAYVWGAFGFPASQKSMDRLISQYPQNKSYLKAAQAIYGNDNAFLFDCVGLIKAVLWGWCGNASMSYGGAAYTANGVPDIDADMMINRCERVSSDFNNIRVGEVVWMPGHIGVYVGDGLCVECTPAWSGGVQLTSCNCTKLGYHRRNWKKHGRLPYITYEKTALESGNDIVWELINGGHKVEITEVDRAVRALDKAKKSAEYSSLYWILYKLVNKE